MLLKIMSVHPFGNGLKFPPRRSHRPKPFRKSNSPYRLLLLYTFKSPDLDWHSQFSDTSRVVYFEVIFPLYSTIYSQNL